MAECAREGEVLDALASARWPGRVDPGLAQHVSSCAICQDVVAVASAMREDHEAAWSEANVPSSGQMWWRAEMRARQDAVREASRPVAVAQGVAVALALTVAAGGGWLAWPAMQAFFTSALLADSPALGSMFVPVAVAMAALLVVAPVALYFVLSEKP